MKTHNLLSHAVKSVLITMASGGFALAVGSAHAAECPIYAIQDNGLNDSQFFTVTVDELGVTAQDLGPLYPDLDIEGLAIHPVTNELYATSGDDAELDNDIGVLYKVDRETGNITRIGKAYDGEISALTFSKDGQHLWGWVDRKGFIEIDPATGVGTMIAEDNTAMIEDITTGLNSAGENILYGVAGNQLYAYNIDASSPTLMACDTLPSEAEAIEMLADGSLLYALHASGDTQIHQFDLDEQCKIINSAPIPTQYYDIEGLAVPYNCGTGLCPTGDAAGWQTVMDSFDDSSESFGFGGTSYEIYSLSVKQVGNEVTVVIRGNLPMQGTQVRSTNVNWGDLIFDFSGNKKGGAVFSSGSDTGVYGVRFSPGNDSGVDGLGLYEVTGLKSVTTSNVGWSHLQHYKNGAKKFKVIPSLGDVSIDNSYFTKFNETLKVPTSINTGHYLSDLMEPEVEVLADYDYDLPGAYLDPRAKAYNLASQDGNPPTIQSISFTFEKTPEMTGDFVAYLFIECMNDGVALKGTFEDCPDDELPTRELLPAEL